VFLDEFLEGNGARLVLSQRVRMLQRPLWRMDLVANSEESFSVLARGGLTVQAAANQFSGRRSRAHSSPMAHSKLTSSCMSHSPLPSASDASNAARSAWMSIGAASCFAADRNRTRLRRAFSRARSLE